MALVRTHCRALQSLRTQCLRCFSSTRAQGEDKDPSNNIQDFIAHVKTELSNNPPQPRPRPRTPADTTFADPFSIPYPSPFPPPYSHNSTTTARSTRTPPPPSPRRTNPPTNNNNNPSNRSAQPTFNTASRLLATHKRTTRRTPAEQARELEQAELRRNLELQMPRRWRVGDVYAPHDLSGVEALKWKRGGGRGAKGGRASGRAIARAGGDVFDRLGVEAGGLYKNFSVMSEFVTEMGRIKHSNETGLRPVNQRKIAKAIRRAVGIGIMPSVHQHPELLEAKERERLRLSRR